MLKQIDIKLEGQRGDANHCAKHEDFVIENRNTYVENVIKNCCKFNFGYCENAI